MAGRRKGAKPTPRAPARPPETPGRFPRLHPRFLEDLRFWVQTEPRVADRIVRLVEETTRDPRSGIGKPEPLKGEHGVWSRRITEEHRLTYRVSSEHVDFLQARFHYGRSS